MKKKINTKAKDKILKAAIREFIDFGFYGARMQRIADQAHVNKALLFYYFSNKKQIYREVLRSIIGKIMDQLNQPDKNPASVEDKIRQVIDAYYNVLVQYPDFGRLMQYEFIQGGQDFLEIMKERPLPFNPVDGNLYVHFHNFIKTGKIKDIDLINLFLSIIGQIIISFLTRPLMESLSRQYNFKFDFKEFMVQRKEFITRLVLEGISNKGDRHA
ncbi:MAG: TetR/AcrR family transcriptional regulator [bacterium]|nr:TetR/AcrR family transcriptional regulator [bacterium]